MSCECMIAGARNADCNGKDCERCGWNPAEAARRNRTIEIKGLRMGSDGLRRLVIRPIKRGGHSGVANQQ